MRDYGNVYSSFWTGETGRAIRSVGRDAQLIAMYLMTAPTSNMIGLYYLPLPIMCYEVGITEQGASKALRSLAELEFCQYDSASETVFLPNMAKFQIGETLETRDNRHKHVLKLVTTYRKSVFIKQFMAIYGEPFNIPEQAPCKPLPKPLPSQKQEQDQKQEKNQNQGQEKNQNSLSAKKTNRADDVRQVFDRFREHHPQAFKSPKAESNEWKKILDRLNEGFSVEDLCDAIDGMHRTPHNLGVNEKQQTYLSLELCMRSGSHVTKYLNAPDRLAPIMSEKEMRGQIAGQQFLERFGTDG